MRLVLGNHADFKYEKTALEHFMQEKGQRAIYLPKFHYELNPIDRVGGGGGGGGGSQAVHKGALQLHFCRP